MRSSGLLFTVYVVIGILVAAGTIGGGQNYFDGLNTLGELADMLLAVLLWPLVLLGIDFNIGGNGPAVSGDSGGGGGGGGGGGKGK